ncbi:MAG: DUF1549 and DUF1553 domain-containing protein [Bryobacteraceae bacterium]
MILAGWVLVMLAAASALAADRPFQFARDIGAILTREGCNSKQCHGGVKGRGGMHLSPEVRTPRDDYQWIVRGGQFQVLTDEVKAPVVPRVDTKAPEKSLLLLKPTLTVPHGGGRRFAVDSEPYRKLLEWIRKGAPFGADREPLERIEIVPPELFLTKGGKVPLRVVAVGNGGSREDITGEIRFESNNDQAMKVSSSGLVEAVAGETAIVAHGAGHTATAFAAVVRPDAEPFPRIARNNFIDDHVQAKLRKLNLPPSGLATDGEFLRRVCLDIAGTLPPPDRVREFLRDRDPDKRRKLIRLLLDSPQYTDLVTMRLADVFRVGGGENESVHWEWVRDHVARNTPYDQIARERIAAQGARGPIDHFGAGEATAMERAVAEEARVFLGRRLDCAQCHNHPYDGWTQDQFWGMAAFFARMTYVNRTVALVLTDDEAGNELDVVDPSRKTPVFAKAEHPRTRKPVTPVFLDGQPLDPRSAADPRLELARRITTHPYFAEAIVNRVWSYFFGRGLVHPVDDFRQNNPPTHPQLLAALAEDFRAHGHDLKRLMRVIAESRTYQTSGSPLPANRQDELNHAWSRPRPMEAEVLLDAISSATAVPESFRSGNGPARLPAGQRAIRIQYPASWEHRFLQVYGCPLRDSVPERRGAPHLGQAMHLLAGETISAKLGAAGGRLDTLVKQGLRNRQIIGELYLAALTRPPSPKEQEEIDRRIAKRPDRREALEDLWWSLLSSREFTYNH